jgi:hypothetical protein
MAVAQSNSMERRFREVGNGKLGSWEVGMDVSPLEVVVSSVAVGSRCGTRPLHAGGDQKCGGSGRGQRDLKQRDPITKYLSYCIIRMAKLS